MQIRKNPIFSVLWMLVVIALGLAMFFASTSRAADPLQQDVEKLSREVEALKKKLADGQGSKPPGKTIGDWLTIGGDFRFRVDSLKGEVAPHFLFQGFDPATGIPVIGPLTPGFDVKNDTLYTNRFGLNLKAKATRNVTVSARLVMYKTFGSSDDAAVSGLQTNDPTTGQPIIIPFFADRVGVFDGTKGHVPDGELVVDYAYATWSNILDQPVWFSVGRRPSTGGVPTHLRQNEPRPGVAGIPALLVDYAFDGMTFGIAPDIEALPGAYVKACYGRGFENGITSSSGNGLRDTEMVGVSVALVDTDPLFLDFQWDHAMNIFDFPVIESNTVFGDLRPTTNLGDIDWYGVTALSTLKNVGAGALNLFLSTAMSVTHPNENLTMVTPAFPGVGLLYSPALEPKDDKTGYAFYVGGRYDFNRNRTKIGVEYNHGSKNWITFAPAADDMWTSKLGTRGDVYEAYLIQEFGFEPISSYLSKTFIRVGYQYYDFEYTGSNNWVGSPVKISDLGSNPFFAQMLIPMKNAQDLYATLEVKF